MHLAGKTIFITGASRGIGKAIAIKAARDGANIAIVAKTTDPHPKLPGTIYSAAEEIRSAGGKALPIACDIRNEEQVQSAIQKTIQEFGGIDIVINNASAISLTNTENTILKKYDLMNQINTRGTFLVSKLAIPYLKKSSNPHILMMSPPPTLNPKWFASHLAYTISKMGMSMCVLGLSEELKGLGIAVNALWPKTLIDSSALQAISSDHQSLGRSGRTVDIVADAAYILLCQPSREYTYELGNFAIDEDLLKSQGVIDFTHYAASKDTKSLTEDIFIEENYTFNSPPFQILKDPSKTNFAKL